MGEQSTAQYIKSMQQIQIQLQKALSKHQEIDNYIRNQMIIPINPGNQPFLKQAQSKFTKNMLQVIECIQKSAPEIQKFNTKVMYASRQKLVEFEGTKYLEPTNNSTIVSSFLNEDLGKLEHAIVEQIEIIDSQKRQNATYAQLNQVISGRIYYTNKTMDSCIDYLLKNL